MTDGLGPGLRAAREARGLSLRSVAGAVGISPSLLSQVETGKTQPSVSTLYAVVTHLGASIDELLGHSPSPRTASAPHSASASPVQRREDNPVVQMENGVTWERLAVGDSTLADPIVTTYAPGGASSLDGPLMRHVGVEYGYIIEGELTLLLDEESFVLRAGDSLCFDSERPHLYVNHTDATTRGIWLVVGAGDPAHGHSEGAGVRTAVDVLATMRGLT